MRPYTKGPWKIDEAEDLPLAVIEDTENGFGICELEGTGDNAVANARLIAASPDILEALDECDTAFAVINIGSDEPMNPQARQAMRTAWEKTQAALAKALGRVDLFKEEKEL